MAAAPLRFAPRDILLAAALVVVLGLGWALRDWSNLAALHLPDTDDAVRLQQIRDWIAGQPFSDLAQHRLGPPAGLEMHWSRLPDLVPAAIIVALKPILGMHIAEVTAVVLWPLLLFFAALLLTAAIARALGTDASTATIAAAVAYPATTIFVPGRIDHHGLQLVLILCLVRACLGRGGMASGIVAALASAVSLAIGLETAPLLLAGAGVLAVRWIARQPGSQGMLAGYGATLTLGLAVEALLLRTSGWEFPACDGFTSDLWRAAQAGAVVPILLAAGATVWRRPGARALASGGLAICVGLIVRRTTPDCLHPYGGVDPLLARLWLTQVGEAQPLLAAPLPNAIGYSGLMLAGLAAAVWWFWRTRDAGWAVLLAFQLAALAVTFAQLRGAYAGALFAAPAMAATIRAARARGTVPLTAAWLASAGALYALVGSGVESSHQPRAAGTPCTTPAGLARIAALPPGRLLAPVDLGAYALAATRHHVIAAPYHRNNQGNRAMYAFFLEDPARSERIAREWRVDYVALCPHDFDEVPAAREPASLIAQLRHRGPPAWLTPLSAPGEVPAIFAVRPR